MTLIVQLVFLLLPAFIYAKCCYNTDLVFKINEGEKLECEDFDAHPYTPPLRVMGAMNQPQIALSFYHVCTIGVCGDGKKKSGTRYCGVGDCNKAGCDCKGGCIEGDPQKSFYAIHGEKVSSLGLGFIDTIREAFSNKE